MADRLIIKNLEPGTACGGFLVVEESTIRPYTKGNFLSMTLSDGLEKIAAVQWDYTTTVVPKVGEVIGVKGTIGTYQGKKQINILGWRPPVISDNIDINSFRAQAKIPARELWDDTMLAIRDMQDSQLQDFVQAVYSRHAELIIECPAGRMMHHAYIGGLLEHNMEIYGIANFADNMMHSGCDKDVLLAGALLHDIGKIFCYRWEGAAIVATAENDLISHVGIGLDICFEAPQRVKHIIASHHGTLDHGALVPPKTLEARLIHYADKISSDINRITAALEDEIVTGNLWPYNHKFYRI